MNRWLTAAALALATGGLSTAGLGAAGAGSALADAAEHRNRAQVRTLLQARTAVDAAQADGMTALHWAVYHDDADMAAQLLRAGATVDVATRYGITPLSLACTNGSGALVAGLLTAGANPNAVLPGGETPLMTAARTGRLAAVTALLSHGATVDAKDDARGQTALMWASAEGHVDVVQALIAHGADLRLHLVSGFTPLLFAVRQGHLDVVRALVKAGADVNEPVAAEPGKRRGYGGPLPKPGVTPLLMAVQNAHFELAAALLDAGADPNAAQVGYTVLHAITAVRKPGVGDNDPAPQGSGSMTSLALVKKLAAAGADLNARMTRKVSLNNTRANEIGATPFFLAALTADAELMTTLAALGADPTRPNIENSTPLMMTAGLATRSPGEDAGTEDEVLEAIDVALKLGADVNAVDANGETAMHAAAYKNLPKVVHRLAEKGARIDLWNKPNRFGWTPLAIAVGYRFGNFKPSPETETAVRTVMVAAGVTPPKTIQAKTQQVY